MLYDHLTIIGGRAHPALAREIAEYLGITLAAVEIVDFPDGEIGVKLNQNIRGCDVFIMQPTGPPVNRNLVELLILIDACRRASAARITAVLPYFGYARQDRKDSGRVPITAKLVANLITTAGADRVFHPAVASIEGDTVVARSRAVRQPVAVRYAWRNATEANLFNGAGLLAPPFRSDSW